MGVVCVLVRVCVCVCACIFACVVLDTCTGARVCVSGEEEDACVVLDTCTGVRLVCLRSVVFAL
jgi:hypothetical protein